MQNQMKKYQHVPMNVLMDTLKGMDGAMNVRKIVMNAHQLTLVQIVHHTTD